MATTDLKAPFPYFGGKRRVASIVWERLGDVANYIEPFAGSAAMLLCRPHEPKIETLNDLDCYVANFWRATQHDPEAVAAYSDGPVNEADLHARHRWLVLSPAAADFRERMRTDPDYFDAKVAGWWCWGLCCWIGSGWCSTQAAEVSQLPRLNTYDRPGLGVCAEAGESLSNQVPQLSAAGQGINAPASGQIPLLSSAVGVDADGGGIKAKRPILTGGNPGEHEHVGKGVHRKMPKPIPDCGPCIARPARGMSQQVPLIGDPPRGGHRGADLQEKRPRAHRAAGSSNSPCNLPGVLSGDIQPGHRPQLADAYARGRGVHGHDEAGTCADRRAWLIDWFGRLRDRLRTVRICCGSWDRVCGSPSVTTRLGTTGVFLDPPYSTEAGRCMDLYGHDSGTVAHEVRAWCLEYGANPEMRICLAGYEGEGHEELESAGWSVVAWKAAGGYANRSADGNANAAKERLWFSPACLDPEIERRPLFFGLECPEPMEAR